MYKKFYVPDATFHFNRRWKSSLPPSSAELELAELRRVHGNVEGARIHRERVARGQVQV